MDPHRLTGPAASDVDDWGNARKPLRPARLHVPMLFVSCLGLVSRFRNGLIPLGYADDERAFCGRLIDVMSAM